jgi:hypothetical protein
LRKREHRKFFEQSGYTHEECPEALTARGLSKRIGDEALTGAGGSDRDHVVVRATQ